MTDEAIETESIPEDDPPRRPRPISPEVQAIPARTPGFTRRRKTGGVEDATTVLMPRIRDAAGEQITAQDSTILIPQVRDAASDEVPAVQRKTQAAKIQMPPLEAGPVPDPPRQQADPAQTPWVRASPATQGGPVSVPVPATQGGWPVPATQVPAPVFDEVPWVPATEPRGSGRRRGIVIGASAAAAVAVAIGGVSLARGSSASATNSAGNGFGPGAGDPTDGAPDGGRPLAGSPSRADGQDAGPGAAASPPGGAPGGQSSPSAAPGNTAPPVSVASSTAPVVVAPPKPVTTPTKPPAPPVIKPNLSCTGWHTTHVVAQDGSGRAAAGTFAMHSGPYVMCGSVGSFSGGQHMYIWCHAINGYGQTWVYGRIDGTNSPAWQALAAFKPGAGLGPVC